MAETETTKGIPYDGPMDAARAGVLLARGEVTFEEVLDGITDGSIALPEIEPPLDKDSDTWWDDVEERDGIPPFYANQAGPNKITREQYVQLRNAISKARGIPEDRWLKD